MEQSSRADSAVAMRVLITLAVLWVALSVPLALLAGRALRSASRMPTLAEEVEAYLRDRAPRLRRRPVGSAVGVLVAFLLAVTFGTRAGQDLPDQAMVTLARWQELAFPDTTTSTKPEPEVVQPVSPATARPEDTATSDPDVDASERRRTSRARPGVRSTSPTVTPSAVPTAPAPKPGATPTGGRTTLTSAEPAPADDPAERRAVAETDGEPAERRSSDRDDDDDDDDRSSRGRRSSPSGEAGTTSTTATTAPPASSTTTSTTTQEPPPGTTTSSTSSTTTTSTTSTTTAEPARDERYKQQGAGADHRRPEDVAEDGSAGEG